MKNFNELQKAIVKTKTKNYFWIIYFLFRNLICEEVIIKILGQLN